MSPLGDRQTDRHRNTERERGTCHDRRFGSTAGNVSFHFPDFYFYFSVSVVSVVREDKYLRDMYLVGV